MRRALLSTLPIVVSMCLLVSCSSDDDAGDDPDVDTEALTAGFQEAAVRAYEGEGKSRDDDFLQGVRSDCFALDDEAIAAIAEALGLEGVPSIGTTYLQGEESQEQLSCSVLVDDEPAFSFTVGSTGLDAEGVVEQRAEFDPENKLIDRAPEGLDADDVVGFRRDDRVFVLYVADGFEIGLGNARDGLDEDDVYAGLPVAVEQVSRVLGG